MSIEDGYYWFRCAADGGTTFIALLENMEWFIPGMEAPVALDMRNMIAPVVRPERGGLN